MVMQHINGEDGNLLRNWLGEEQGLHHGWNLAPLLFKTFIAAMLRGAAAEFTANSWRA